MELITIKEAADILKLNEKTVINYLNDGKLTKFRGPEGTGPVRVSLDEVKNFFRPEPRPTEA